MSNTSSHLDTWRKITLKDMLLQDINNDAYRHILTLLAKVPNDIVQEYLDADRKED